MERPEFKLWTLMAIAACCALSAAGCGQRPAQFRLNMVAMAENGVTEGQQQQIADILTALFGTPDEPFAPAETGLDLDKLRRASGPVHRDAPTGSPKGLYREHCVHCHGISGDGAGPTAAFLNPYPRDYRYGIYKFKSTKLPNRPTSANLMRTLHEGITGTAMPSFKLMPEIHREALVEYVRYLSMRGEMEIELAKSCDGTKGAAIKDDHDSLVEILEPIASSWQKPTEVAVTDRPADMQFDKIEDPATRKAVRDFSIALGREMFTNEKEGEFEYKPPDGSPPMKIKYQGAACIKCHGPTGLGDGQASDYDDWTKLAYSPDYWRNVWNKDWGDLSKQGPLVPEWLVAPLGALPARNIVPRNLRLGVYRGGRRPLDIYYRLHEGIKGTPMPQIAVLYLPSEIDELKKSAAADFAKSNPEPTKKDGESNADFDKRHKSWESQQTAQVNKKVDAAKQDLQNRRTWNVIDYVLSLPYEPGGELGADADITDVGHGELHSR